MKRLCALFLSLPLLLLAGPSSAQDYFDWRTDDPGFNELSGDYGDEGFLGIGEEETAFEDDYAQYNYAEDDYGYYDTGYDWEATDENFDTWYGESDEDWADWEFDLF